MRKYILLCITACMMLSMGTLSAQSLYTASLSGDPSSRLISNEGCALKYAYPAGSTLQDIAANYSTKDDDSEVVVSSSKKYKKTKKKKKKGFNAPKTDSFWGVSAGYTSKVWKKEQAGVKSDVGLYGSDWLHGIQFGVRFNPLFKYGFGMSIGLQYEYYHNKSSLLTNDSEPENTFNYYQTLSKHVLRLPIHLEYRLNFSKSFQLFFYGGIVADYIISGEMDFVKEGELNSYLVDRNIYGTIIPSAKRYNASLLYGGGIRIYAVQFNVNSEMGLINLSPSEEYILKQNNPLTIALSIMF